MRKNSHFSGQPLYGQVIKLLDKSKILAFSRENGGERYVKRFNCWIHLVVMLYAVIMRFDSLIANLLLMVMQKGLKRQWSFSGLATMVRITLMYYVDFHSLFNNPEKEWCNADEDYYVCPMGQHMTRIGTARSKTANGYRSENARYRAQNCNGCPLRYLCYKAKDDRRIIEVNHRLNKYKKKARELLTSEDGLKHRGLRCIPRGRLRTDEVQHGIPTLPPLRERQGHFGLCLLRHSLQHQENVFKDSQTDQKRGKYTPFWSVYAYLKIFTV